MFQNQNILQDETKIPPYNNLLNVKSLLTDLQHLYAYFFSFPYLILNTIYFLKDYLKTQQVILGHLFYL